jgi:hypothetical protein
MSVAAAKVLLAGIRERNDDVFKVLDRLYRQRRLTLAHMRALRAGTSPRGATGDQITLIEEAARAADHALRCKGLLPMTEAA